MGAMLIISDLLQSNGIKNQEKVEAGILFLPRASFD
jgi:hypothetical protein